MIAIYIILGIFYFLNLIIFSVIHIKKNKLKTKETHPNERLISLLNDNTSMGEPLLSNF